jgi:hypothetical protein
MEFTRESIESLIENCGTAEDENTLSADEMLSDSDRISLCNWQMNAFLDELADDEI